VKRFNIILLMLSMLTILASGQSVAVAALVVNSNSSNTPISFKPDDMLSEEDFDVKILFVGLGSTSQDELRLQGDGSYHVITDFDLASVTIKLDVSGMTCWGLDAGLGDDDCIKRTNTYTTQHGPTSNAAETIMVPGENNVTYSELFGNGTMYPIGWKVNVSDPTEALMDFWKAYVIDVEKHNVTTGAMSFDVDAFNSTYNYAGDSDFNVTSMALNGTTYDRFYIAAVNMTNIDVFGEQTTFTRPTPFNITVPAFYGKDNLSYSSYEVQIWDEAALPADWAGSNATDFNWDGLAETVGILLPVANTSSTVAVGSFTSEVLGWTIPIPALSATADGESIDVPAWVNETITFSTENKVENYWEGDAKVQRNRDDALATVGQLYTIIDGVAEVESLAAYGDRNDITLSQGDHVVTFLYVGKDEADGFLWASETIHIRVAKSEDAINKLGYFSVPLTTTITDAADTMITAGTKLEAEVLTWFFESEAFGVPFWIRDNLWAPTGDLTIKYGKDPANPTQDLVLSDDSEINVASPDTVLDISGSVNSSGFEGYQMSGSWDVTKGHYFLMDAFGVRPLADATTAALFTTDAIVEGSELAKTYVGVLVLSEYGLQVDEWCDTGLPVTGFPTGGEAGICYSDWEYVQQTSDAVVAFDASFDFVHETFGVTVFDNPIFGVTESSTSFSTSTKEASTIQVTKEEPGFLLLTSLLAVGVIAFVIPRFRREIR
jgi:hypothetical protein